MDLRKETVRIDRPNRVSGSECLVIVTLDGTCLRPTSGLRKVRLTNSLQVNVESSKSPAQPYLS